MNKYLTLFNGDELLNHNWNNIFFYKHESKKDNYLMQFFFSLFL